MRRLLFVLLLIGATTVGVLAQTPLSTFETVTFSSTAVGLSTATIAPPGGQMTVCVGKVETAAIRIRFDGGAPTASVGTPIGVGETFRIGGQGSLQSFRGIKSGASDASVAFHCSALETLSLTGAGSSGGGGGGSGDASLAEQQTQTASLQLIDNLANTIGSTTSGEYGALVFGAVSTGAPTYIDAKSHPLSLNTSGELRTACSNCSGTGASVTDNAAYTLGSGVAAPAGFLFDDVSPGAATENRVAVARMSGNRVAYALLRDAAGNERGANVTASNALSGDVTSINNVTPLMGNGATGTGSLRVTLANNNTVPTDWPTATLQTTLNGYVDGVETLLTTVATLATALGAAGSPAAGVITVQGVTDMTPISASVSNLPVFASGTSVANNSSGFLSQFRKCTTVASLSGVDAGESEVPCVYAGGLAMYVIDPATGTPPTFATDGVQGSTLPTSGPMQMLEAKTLDGSALPNSVSEGQPVRQAGTQYGVSYTMLATADGAKSPIKLEDDAHTSADAGLVVFGRRIDAAAPSSGTSGDYETFNMTALGALWVSEIDPCSFVAKTTTPFSVTADTVMINATASKKNYICSIAIVAGAAENFGISEGASGSTCATSRAALLGNTTDSQGAAFAANGGMVYGNGAASVIQGKTANVDTCFFVNSGSRIAGSFSWVQAP